MMDLMMQQVMLGVWKRKVSLCRAESREKAKAW